MYTEFTEAYAQYQIASLRCILQSGDWLSVDNCKKILNQFPQLKLYSLGGATEAAIWSIIYEVKCIEQNCQTIPYGYALPGQQVLVYDENMQLCPPLVTGNLYISGDGLALGYVNDPQLTAQKFIWHEGKKLYKTGDRGRYFENYCIEFLGRSDLQVKINGFRIE